MFGFLKRKRQSQQFEELVTQRVQELACKLVPFLEMQTALLGATIPEIATSRHKAIKGYIFGLYDAAVIVAIDNGRLPPIRDGSLQAGAVQHFYSMFLSESLASNSVDEAFSLMTDQEFARGRQLGGDDYTNFLRTHGKSMPFGLRQIFHGR